MWAASVQVIQARTGAVLLANDGQTLTYGSGFTGIDTGAAAFDEVMKGRGQAWEYRYAAESESRLHAPLVKAWGQRGLSLARARPIRRAGDVPSATS